MAAASLPTRLQRRACSPAARPLRFAGTGGAAGAIQLLLLAAMIHAGWNAIAANAVAFLLAAQLNFALSSTLTWGDRRRPGSLLQRWLLFHASIACMAGVNMLTFLIIRAAVPNLAASTAGIVVAAIGNYLAGDRIVFRTGSTSSSGPSRNGHLEGMEGSSLARTLDL